MSNTVLQQPSQRLQQNKKSWENRGLVLTAFEGKKKLVEAHISAMGKSHLTYGRALNNDVVIDSPSRIVSRSHGTLTFENGSWYIECFKSATNGLRVNGYKVTRSPIVPGDIAYIGNLSKPEDCVIIAVGYEGALWNNIVIPRDRVLRIGRLSDNDVVLPSPMVSGHHALIEHDEYGRPYIQNLSTSNGTYVNGTLVQSEQLLNPGDIISMSLTSATFTGSSLLYSTEKENRGVDVVAHDLVQIRKRGSKEFVTTNHISLHIRRGDFVAIVGGSGSGKTTLLDELSGTEFASSGKVYLDGIDLYNSYGQLRSAIGYVPQKDIVYDDLKLIDMLRYAAELRMPTDATRDEREQRIDEVLGILGLSGQTDNFIRSLSGGQKKRASIAVELLADPRLLFLDEPTSGLDPGIERELMHTLARMAHEGRTIILVTHTTLNLHLCSQVVFLGRGGQLCFMGPPKEALSFFGVDDYVEVYKGIDREDDAKAQAQRFAAAREEDFRFPDSSEGQIAPSKGQPFTRQLSTLTRRYMQLLLNDRQRLLLLLLQAPALSALICLVAGNDCFVVCEKTKSCLFALSCAAFWVGILNSIQEICKERTILKREHAGGLKVSAYLASKVLVLGLLCAIQAGMLTAVFCAMNGLPSVEPLIIGGGFELFVTMLLLTLSAMCLGLWISALVSNPDRAIAMAPIMIMPQVLFSGLIFELKGIAKNISIFVNCRWAMEAFGATADLNTLDLAIYGEQVTVPEGTQHIDSADVPIPDMTTTYMGQEVTVEGETRTIENFDVRVPEQQRTIDSSMYAHKPDHAYDHVLMHLLTDWTVLAVFCVICILLSSVTLHRSLRQKAR